MRTTFRFSCLVFVSGLATLTSLGAQQPAPAPEAGALTSMVEAERAFAATALQKGIRDAFVEFFADDSIGFYPEPANARTFYQQRPPSPLTRRLEWEPRTGDIARSGDMGWLTGPSVLSDTKTTAPPQYGCYFSIWRRDAGGPWKVLMDVGTQTDEPVTFAHAGFEPVAEPAGRFEGDGRAAAPGIDEILRVDREVSGAMARDTASGYDKVLTPVSRLHASGQQPLVGRDAILGSLKQRDDMLAFTPQAGGVARSGDLAFTRGSYQPSSDPESQPSGYYVRMWKRVRDGNWTLAVEVRNEIPKE